MATLLLAVTGLQAQDCATGFCPETITVHHAAGDISPETVTITYPVVETTLGSAGNDIKQCWLAQNLGATTQAGSATDPGDAAAGWYWQFNRKQGYAINTNGTPTTTTDDVRTPNTAWISSIDENSDWTLANDPCRLLLGGGWRLPTNTEWTNADSKDSWGNYGDSFGSVLKLHTTGFLSLTTGELINRGAYGYCWSSSTNDSTSGYYLNINNSNVGMFSNKKTSGFPVRCLSDL